MWTLGLLMRELYDLDDAESKELLKVRILPRGGNNHLAAGEEEKKKKEVEKNIPNGILLGNCYPARGSFGLPSYNGGGKGGRREGGSCKSRYTFGVWRDSDREVALFY